MVLNIIYVICYITYMRHIVYMNHIDRLYIGCVCIGRIYVVCTVYIHRYLCIVARHICDTRSTLVAYSVVMYFAG